MTNIEIKKGIKKAVKYKKEYKINLILFHGDGIYHKDEEEPIYNDLTVWSGEEIIFSTLFGSEDLTESEENLKILRTEQKKMCNYLKKHFKNVTIAETNV